jgi:secreted trypsin-like serine protease
MGLVRSFLLAAIALALTAAPAAAIVGGTPATRDYPHMAALEFRQDDGDWTFSCGASLVRADVVLTAAHCVQDDGETASREDEAGRYRFLIGTRDRQQGGERIEAVRLVDHPQYDPRSGAYDIALLKLARPAALGAPIRIASPEEADRYAPGDEATIIGWGATVSGGPPTRELREGQVPIVGDAECESTNIATSGFDPATMICAGNLTGGEDSCQGDSGGPLMVPDAAGRLVLVGDVSFGFGCAFPTQYGVYGEVAGATLRGFVDATAAELSPQSSPPSGGGGGPAASSPPVTVRLPRRLSGRLRVLVRVSGPVSGIRLRLRRGGRTIATGRRARTLASRGRIALRPRRVRTGRARLVLTARDAEGRTVRAARRVRVAR